MKLHVLKDGDHIHGISAANGFRRYLTVWQRPENADVRAARPNADTLLPGDRVTVPDLETRNEEGATEKRHKFVALRPRPLLRLRWLRFGRTPKQNWSTTLSASGAESALVTNADGEVALRIDPLATDVRASSSNDEFLLKVGFLHPFDAESGWLARLHNLGYLPSTETTLATIDAIEVASAIEEFQCDHSLVVNGKVDATFLAALRDAHGC